MPTEKKPTAKKPAAPKKKKVLRYNGKPLIRVGDRLFYGNLDDKLILVLDVLEKRLVKGVRTATKVQILLMDNTGEIGDGQVYRKGQRSDIRKALDIGEWWLQEALRMIA